MSLELMIYFASVAQSLKTLFMIAGVIGTIAICFFIVITTFESFGGYSEEDRERAKEIQKQFLWAKLLFPALLVFGVLIPSERAIYTMAAVNVSKKVVESKDFQTMYSKVYKLIEEKLDDTLTTKEKLK